MKIRDGLFGLLCIAGLTWAVVSPVLDSGLARGSDVDLHIGNVIESAFLLEYGWPPWGWLPDVAGGYGGPNYFYYGHLSFVIPAYLVRLGCTPEEALQWTVLVCLVLASLGSYVWASQFGGRWLGLLGAVLYVWSPYVSSLSHVRAAYPELFAVSLYPFLMASLSRAIARDELRWSLVAAALGAVIVGSHTLSLILIAIAGGLYLLGVAIINRHLRARAARVAFTSFVVGGALASPWLYFPIFGKSWVDLGRQFVGFEEQYVRAAVPWWALLNREPVDGKVVSYLVPGRFHLVLVAVAGWTVWRGRSGNKKVYVLHLVCAITGLALITPFGAAASVAVMRPIRYLQFPWRLLSVFAVFSCAAVCSGLRGAIERVGMGVATAAAIIAPIYYIGTLPKQGYVGTWSTPRDVQASLSTLDHEDKYMPLSAVRFHFQRSESMLVLLEGGRVRLLSETPQEYIFEAESASEGVAVFNQYWFPCWQAYVNGEPVILQSDSEGLCALRLPKGKHRVRVALEDPLGYAIAKCLAVGTAVSIALFCIVRLIRRVSGSRFHHIVVL